MRQTLPAINLWRELAALVVMAPVLALPAVLDHSSGVKFSCGVSALAMAGIVLAARSRGEALIAFGSVLAGIAMGTPIVWTPRTGGGAIPGVIGGWLVYRGLRASTRPRGAKPTWPRNEARPLRKTY